MIPILAAALLMAADVPARIVNPTPEGRASLARAVQAALGAPVRLADDALTAESTLVIERANHRGPGGIRLQGRELSPPERFQLVKSGGGCVLVHERTGRRFALDHTGCVEVKAGE